MEGWVTDISLKKTVYPASFYQLWPPDDPENEGHPAGWGGGSRSDGAAQCGAEQWWCSGAGQQWEDHYSRDCPIHLGGERERKKKRFLSVPLFCLVHNSLLIKDKTWEAHTVCLKSWSLTQCISLGQGHYSNILFIFLWMMEPFFLVYITWILETRKIYSKKKI